LLGNTETDGTFSYFRALIKMRTLVTFLRTNLDLLYGVRYIFAVIIIIIIIIIALITLITSTGRQEFPHFSYI
jgi:hypothetical protein